MKNNYGSGLIGIALLFSVIHLFVVTGGWTNGVFLLYFVACCMTLLSMVYSVNLLRHRTKNNQATVLLLAMLMVEYWVWILFAQYAVASSFVFLFFMEGIRLLVIFFLLSSVKKAFTLFMLKFFLLDFCYVMLSRSGSGPESSMWHQWGIIHPLEFFPLFVLFFFQLNCIGLYVVKFRDK